MDLFTKINKMLFIESVRKIAEKEQVIDSITPITNGNLETFFLTPEWKFSNYKNYILVLLNFMYSILPASDNPTYSSIEELKKEVCNIYGNIISVYKPQDWSSSPTSDETLVNILKQGIGSHLIEKHGDEYCVDLSYMEDFAVREGLMRYGSKIAFDRKFNLLYIRYDGEMHIPGKPTWETAKYIFRSSLIVTNIIRTHATLFHMFFASNIAASLRCLPEDHKLRIFMTPFQFGNLEAAAKARRILYEGTAYFKRMFGFTNSSLKEFIEHSVYSCKYEPFPVKYKRLGRIVFRSPYHKDGILVWNTINNFVKDYFIKYDIDYENPFTNDLFYRSHGEINIKSHEELIDLITEFIFISTCAHEVVGNSIFKYTYNPDLMSPKLYKDAVQKGTLICDTQSYHQIVLLSVLTSMLRLPKIMDDFSFLFPKEDHEMINKFKEELKNVSDVIHERNRERDEPFIDMNPENLEISMSA